jgi:hypothetical protein
MAGSANHAGRAVERDESKCAADTTTEELARAFARSRRAQAGEFGPASKHLLTMRIERWNVVVRPGPADAADSQSRGRKRHSRPALALVVIGMLSTACVGADARSATPDTTAAEVLWLPIDAVIESDAARPVMFKDGRSIYIDDTGAVVFSLNADREELTRQVVQHFATTEWQQRERQFLNPDTATSFAGGWERRCSCVMLTDWQGNPVAREPFYQWHGEWEDLTGNLVTYTLSGEGRQLRGHASYRPLKVVTEMRERLGAERQTLATR